MSSTVCDLLWHLVKNLFIAIIIQKNNNFVEILNFGLQFFSVTAILCKWNFSELLLSKRCSGSFNNGEYPFRTCFRSMFRNFSESFKENRYRFWSKCESFARIFGGNFRPLPEKLPKFNDVPTGWVLCKPNFLELLPSKWCSGSFPALVYPEKF